MDPCPKNGFVHDSCVLSLEPVIPPAKTFLQEADLRTGQSTHRIFVSPGADQSFSGTTQSFQHSWNRIAVWIGPTSNGKHRTFYFGKILTDRTMFPKRVPILMLEPGFDLRCQALHSASVPFFPCVWLVRGNPVRWAEHDPRPCLIPPDWSGGYSSIFAAQVGEDS